MTPSSPPPERKTLQDYFGSDPDFTGGMDSVEYVRRQRGPGPDGQARVVTIAEALRAGHPILDPLGGRLHHPGEAQYEAWRAAQAEEDAEEGTMPRPEGNTNGIAREVVGLLKRADRPLGVAEISATLGRSVTGVSNHLGYLHATGQLSRSGRRGRYRYRLASPATPTQEAPCPTPPTP